MDTITRRTAIKSLSAGGIAAVIPGTVVAAENEHPADKVRRISRELATALIDYEGGNYAATVFAADRTDYPVGIVMDAEYNRMSRALWAYRNKYGAMMKAHRALQQSAEKPLQLTDAIKADQAGYWDAKHECELAHAVLIATFGNVDI